MMIRSAPPASAHFAESPVPAPAPMIGLPCCDLRPQARERFRPCHCVVLDHRVQPVGHRVGERGVVDVEVAARAPRPPAPSVSCRPCEERRVRLGVVERLALDRDHRDALSGTKSAVGPVAAESLRPICRPSSRHSSGVVRISVTVGLWT